MSLILADLPAEQAAARAIDRFRTTGRFVDPDYVLSVADGPKRAYMETRGLADEHAHYTTDGPRGSPPRFRDGSRDLLADVRLDAGSGRGAADAVGEQAGAGDPRRRAADPGTAADAAGTSRSGDDADLLVLTEAVDELARLGRLDETDLATIRQGNDAAAKAAAMADALDAAAACMLRAA
ncbi:hypothetical protein [Elioraea thermophila]|uniref:hypothetical protein n=1 Tax=Elioraea thermophila TaxID=2185104 RepID=UPI000DF1D3C1|nr:hypothetical protein [Elioraea thermophila]